MLKTTETFSGWPRAAGKAVTNSNGEECYSGQIPAVAAGRWEATLVGLAARKRVRGAKRLLSKGV
jgi:hypothetical protein